MVKEKYSSTRSSFQENRYFNSESQDDEPKSLNYPPLINEPKCFNKVNLQKDRKDAALVTLQDCFRRSVDFLLEFNPNDDFV